MAKMFYSLQEAAERLGKTQDELKAMAESGQIQEFRDGDKMMFKRDQIDLLTDDDGGEIGLAGGPDESAIIGLADSTEMGSKPVDASGELDLAPLDAGGDDDVDLSGDLAGDLAGDTGGGLGSGFDLGASGSMIGLADSTAGAAAGAAGAAAAKKGVNAKEQTGISIFDADDVEDFDPAAQTNVDIELDAPDFATMDAGGSGSGLLDLTRESDDTSLGADLLDDVYGGDTADQTAGETMPDAAGSALFESTDATEGADLEAAGAGLAMIAAEPYDGAGSGLVGGLALGMVAVLGLTATTAVLGFISQTGSEVSIPLVDILGEKWMIVAGSAAGAVLLFGLIGWALGRRG